MQILPSVDEALTSSDVQAAAELAIEAKHLDHYVILQGSGAGSGITGFSINSVSGIATDDLIGNRLLHVNSGQVRRITDADISGSTLTGTVDPQWNNTPGLGATFIVLPGVNDFPTAVQVREEMDSNSTQLAAIASSTSDWDDGGRLDLILDSLVSGQISAADVWTVANAIDGTYTPTEALTVVLAALAGKLSGAQANAPVMRDSQDTKDVITAVTDANGNRTSVTITP